MTLEMTPAAIERAEKLAAHRLAVKEREDSPEARRNRKIAWVTRRVTGVNTLTGPRFKWKYIEMAMIGGLEPDDLISETLRSIVATEEVPSSPRAFDGWFAQRLAWVARDLIMLRARQTAPDKYRGWNAEKAATTELNHKVLDGNSAETIEPEASARPSSGLQEVDSTEAQVDPTVPPDMLSAPAPLSDAQLILANVRGALTAREAQVADLISDRYTEAEIAEMLGLTVNAVQQVWRRVLAKVRSGAEGSAVHARTSGPRSGVQLPSTDPDGPPYRWTEAWRTAKVASDERAARRREAYSDPKVGTWFDVEYVTHVRVQAFDS